MKRCVGISTKYLQEKYGDNKALEIAAKIGADAVDFGLDIGNDYRSKDSLYSRGEEAVTSYYQTLKDYAESLGLFVSQTHGRHTGFRNIKEEDDALVENARFDCLATAGYGNPTPAEVIRRLGGKIAVLHLNDNDTLTDQHKIPMTGVIDWTEVFDALDEINYEGVYNMELNLKHFGDNLLAETAEFAIKVMRNFLANRYGC